MSSAASWTACKPRPGIWRASRTPCGPCGDTGSELEVLLRAGEGDHLVLCGSSTSGVVLSTVREAADKDYRLTVLQDLCAAPAAEVHTTLTRKVFPRQARVLGVVVWLGELSGAAL